MTDAIAVVIPAFDAAAFLPVALQSLQQQTLPPAEVVVVDDGSTDDTAAVAGRFGAQLLRQERRGPGAARNRGLRATNAPLVAFLDADDWFAPDKLARQAARLRELDARVLCTDAFVADVDGVVGRRKNDRRRVPATLTFEQLLRDNPVICSTVMARRDAIAAAGGFDEDPRLVATEDYDLWLRLARHGPLAYLDAPLTYYRLHAGSLSANRRFLHGVDRIMDKVEPGAAPHLRQLVRRRRAGVRLDLAWDLLQAAATRSEALALIREAQRQAFTWKGCRMWLRSCLRR